MLLWKSLLTKMKKQIKIYCHYDSQGSKAYMINKQAQEYMCACVCLSVYRIE